LFARTLGVLDLCAEGHYSCDFFLVINIDEERIEKKKVHKQFLQNVVAALENQL